MFKIKIHVHEFKRREEMLDLYKHISDRLMERKVNRLMLSKKIWYMKKGIW